MRKIILEGFLGDKYGREWEFVARSYADIVNCMEANFPGFRDDLIDFYKADGGIAVVSGGQLLEDPDELFYPIDKDTIVITPVPEGSKSGGAKLILGTLLIAALFIFMPVTATLASGFAAGATATQFAAAVFVATTLSIGVNLALTGLQQLLAPDPSVDQGQDQKYLFDGPENTVASGNPVPILCGEMIIGGILMSTAVVPGAPSSVGHVGGYFPGAGGVNLPGGTWGSFGGGIGGDIVDPNGITLGVGYDAIVDSALGEPDESLILYSSNTFSKPWVAKEPRMGVSYIAPVVPHEIPSTLLTDHYLAIRKDQFTKEVLWDDFEDVVIGTLPANGNLFKILDSVSTNITADFSGTATAGSLSATLGGISIFAEADAAIIGNASNSLDTIGITSVGSFTGVGAISGALAATTDALTVSSVGTAEFIVASSITLDSLTSTSVATAPYIATSESTFDTITISSDGTFTAGASYETEATALFARFTNDPGSTRKTAINDCIAGLKTDGVWSKLDSLFVFAAHDRQAAFEDWVTSRTAVDVGTGPNFTADNYISNAADADTNYLNTTLNLSTLSRNSASCWGIATKSAGTAYRRLIDEYITYIVAFITTPDPTDMRGRMSGGNDGLISFGAGNTSSAITYITANDDGTNMKGYRNASETDSITRINRNYLGTVRVFPHTATTDGFKIYATHFGGSLTPTEIGYLNDRLATYFTAVGAS